MSKVYPDITPERLAGYIGNVIMREWPLNNGSRLNADIAVNIGLRHEDIIKKIGINVEAYLRKYLLSNSPNITQHDKDFALDLFVICLHPLTVQQISEGLLEFQCADKGKLDIAIIKRQLYDNYVASCGEGNYDSIEDPQKEFGDDTSLIGLGSLDYRQILLEESEWY